MTESKVFGVISTVLTAAGAELFSTLTAGAVFAGFIVCLLLSVFKSGYGLKKRLWFLLVVVIFSALLKTRASVTGGRDFSALLLFFGAVLFLPVYFIREKPIVTHKNSDAREYVRRLEDRIKRATDFENSPFTNAEKQTEIPEVLKAEPQKPTATAINKPDFSHVKNVLQRLEPATLSYADRRQIHELELSLYEAENGDYSEETRRKINEGLGNLLKIMARHGV